MMTSLTQKLRTAGCSGAAEKTLRAQHGSALVRTTPSHNNHKGDSVGQRGAARINQRSPTGECVALKNSHRN